MTTDTITTPARLNQARRVLKLDTEGTRGVYFANDVDGDLDSLDRTETRITAGDYADFGEPECVTVTIEPGDKLNVEELALDLPLPVPHGSYVGGREGLRLHPAPGSEEFARDLASELRVYPSSTGPLLSVVLKDLAGYYAAGFRVTVDQAKWLRYAVDQFIEENDK